MPVLRVEFTKDDSDPNAIRFDEFHLFLVYRFWSFSELELGISYLIEPIIMP